MKNKKCKSKVNEEKSDVFCAFHLFDNDTLPNLRSDLLEWYDQNHRTLPWRTIAKQEKDPNKRGYAVWVSEIMLQQTQVSTVIDYYNKWISKWPTVSFLLCCKKKRIFKKCV